MPDLLVDHRRNLDRRRHFAKEGNPVMADNLAREVDLDHRLCRWSLSLVVADHFFADHRRHRFRRQVFVCYRLIAANDEKLVGTQDTKKTQKFTSTRTFLPLKSAPSNAATAASA